MGNALCCASTPGADTTVLEMPVPARGVQIEQGQKDPELVITVVGARGVRSSEWLPGTGKPDCYCEVRGGAEKLYTTKAIGDVLEPVWLETFEVAEIADDSALEFSVYDKLNDRDPVGSSFLGVARLEAKDYARAGFNGELKLADAGVEEAYIRVKVKVAHEELPMGLPAEFTITVERASKEESFGIRFDTRDQITCQVLEVTPGLLFSNYNESAPPEEQVKVHDFITSVNGISGSNPKMIEQFRASLKVECTVQRSVCTSVIYDRGDASEALGLEFCKYPTADVLVITGVDGKRNRSAGEHERLCPGDRIVSLRSLQCRPAELEDQLRAQSGKVQLVVMRPAAAHAEGGLERPVHWLLG